MESKKWAYVVYDTKTNSIVAICDNEKKQKEIIRSLIIKDMETQILKYDIGILENEIITDNQQRQSIVNNLKLQLKMIKNNPNNFNNSYMLNGECLARYAGYGKEINSDETVIFLISQSFKDLKMSDDENDDKFN
jgi:hypothetical protein